MVPMGFWRKEVIEPILDEGTREAIAEGRQATAAERNQTIGDLAGGRDASRDIERQVAAAGPVIQQGIQSLARALPAMLGALDGLTDDFDRAAANLPQPGYPRR